MCVCFLFIVLPYFQAGAVAVRPHLRLMRHGGQDPCPQGWHQRGRLPGLTPEKVNDKPACGSVLYGNKAG
jgi:hypothetical protein